MKTGSLRIHLGPWCRQCMGAATRALEWHHYPHVRLSQCELRFHHRRWQSVHAAPYERRIPITHNSIGDKSPFGAARRWTLNCNDGAVCVIKEMLDNKQGQWKIRGGKKDGCDSILDLKCWQDWEASFSCVKTTERCNARRTQIAENLCAEAWGIASRWLLKSSMDGKHREFENGEPGFSSEALGTCSEGSEHGLLCSNKSCCLCHRRLQPRLHSKNVLKPSISVLVSPCVCYETPSYSHTVEDTLINTFYIYNFFPAAPPHSVILLKGLL